MLMSLNGNVNICGGYVRRTVILSWAFAIYIPLDFGVGELFIFGTLMTYYMRREVNSQLKGTEFRFLFMEIFSYDLQFCIFSSGQFLYITIKLEFYFCIAFYRRFWKLRLTFLLTSLFINRVSSVCCDS